MSSLNPLTSGFEAQIQAVVHAKLFDLEAMANDASTGRLLTFSDLPAEQHTEKVMQGITEIASYVGVHYVSKTPAQVLEQLVIAAHNSGQSPSVVVKTMLDNFLLAFITPATQAGALSVQEQLSVLRKEVEAIRLPAKAG